jgi:hypothetical protein
MRRSKIPWLAFDSPLLLGRTRQERTADHRRELSAPTARRPRSGAPALSPNRWSSTPANGQPASLRWIVPPPLQSGATAGDDRFGPTHFIHSYSDNPWDGSHARLKSPWPPPPRAEPPSAKQSEHELYVVADEEGEAEKRQ